MVHIIYGQESVQQIVVRYEAPVCGNRWDAPLHLVLRDGQVDCQVDIFWVYRQTNRPFFCSLSINNLLAFQLRYHRQSATPYSTANLSNQICQLKMHHWQVKVVLLFFFNMINLKASWFLSPPLYSIPNFGPKRTWGFIFVFCREWFCSPAGLTMPGSDSGDKPFALSKYPVGFNKIPTDKP